METQKAQTHLCHDQKSLLETGGLGVPRWAVWADLNQVVGPIPDKDPS